MANSKKVDKSKKIKKPLFPFLRDNATPETFGVGKYDLVHLKGGNLRFRNLYGHKSLWLRYLLAIFMGLVMAVAIQFLLKNTGLYNSGLSALAQGVSRITYTEMLLHNKARAELTFNIVFWTLYVILNLPLFAFGYIKIGKTFASLTLVFLIVNCLAGFGISSIPGANNVLFLGPSIAKGDGTSQNEFVKYGINNIPFWFKTNNLLIFNQDYDPYRGLFLFLYAIVYGLVSGFCYALLYIVGGSSAGMDFVSIYFASVRHRPLGPTVIIVNTVCLFVGCVTGSYIPAGLVNSQGFNVEFLFSANLVASFLAVLLMGILISRFFPLHRMVKVEILSPKVMEIRNALFDANFTHSMSFTHCQGAYSLGEKNVLWTVCMYVETPNLFNHIRKVDPDALVIVTTATDINGKVRIYRQGSTEK